MVLDKLSSDSIATLDIKGRSPLYLAAMSGHYEVLEMLLKANYNSTNTCFDGTTPIQAAAKRGHTKCVVLLTSSQTGSVRVTETIYETPYQELQEAKNKAFPLLFAVTTGSLEKLKAAVSAEGSENAPQLLKQADIFRVNALHVAAARGYVDILEHLLEEVRDSLANLLTN